MPVTNIVANLWLCSKGAVECDPFLTGELDLDFEAFWRGGGLWASLNFLSTRPSRMSTRLPLSLWVAMWPREVGQGFMSQGFSWDEQVVLLLLAKTAVN